MVKRFIPVLALTLAAGSSTARAAVPDALLCNDSKTVNCVKDEIVILDGNTLDHAGLPLATECQTRMVDGREERVCSLANYGAAVQALIDFVTRSGVTNLKWDTVAIFGADFGSVAPRFIRQNSVNEVRGIGLAANPWPANQLFVGFIAGGSTSEFGVFKAPPREPPKGITHWPDPDPAGVEGYQMHYPRCQAPALCFEPFFNGYQALAQAVGHMYGPHLQLPNAPTQSVISEHAARIRGTDGSFAVQADGRASPIAGGSSSIWNSLFDFGGSLMGGNNWRNNGNGELQITAPQPHWAASLPYQGQRLLRFHPYDLYLMGLLPPERLTAIPDYSPSGSWQSAHTDPVTGRSRAFPTRSTGMLANARIKLLPIVGSVVVTGADRTLEPREIFEANGLRDPAFASAPHTHRQLWVIVTKPNDPEKTAEQIDYMLRWRRAWNQYYYMLTSYLGRMVTTFDGKEDDSAYWEFAQTIDDEKTFTQGGGLEAVFPGPLQRPGSEVIESFVRVNTPGATGALQFQPHTQQLPIRIKGQQDHPGATNALVVRMRLQRDSLGSPTARASALVQLDTGVTLRLPSHPDSFLIPDGHWHDYSIDLSKVPGFVDRDHTGFTFVPSDLPASNIDIEFIRFTWVNPEDLGDDDRDCDGTLKPDGFINPFDNCPDLYNPDQRDSDQDGVGDACGDVDLDGTVNICDNCPTLSNSRQRDRNNNGVGDECDPEQSAGCFLQPESSVAGRHRPHTGFALVATSVIAGLGLLLRRRRKR